MLIAGNLDVEVTWARMDAATRRARGEKAPSPDDPRFALPEPVMRKVSAAATLMRVAAMNDSDTLWTPRPVEPTRMARIDWLPWPRLVSGPVPEAADVWWGERTEVAARVNDRAFAAGIGFGGVDDCGAEVVRTLEELAARAAPLGPWVAKAPHSAAGRQRVRGAGALDDRCAAHADRLLRLHGRLLLEPWFERAADLGAVGFVHPGHEELVGGLVHRLHVDGAGRFEGITTPAGEIPPEHVASAGRAAAFAGGWLQADGYAGPFGVDLILVRDPAGGTRLRRCEINARRTFGHVAHDLARRARPVLGLGEAEPVTLRFGRGAPPDGTLALLLPGADDDTSAWLEARPRHAG